MQYNAVFDLKNQFSSDFPGFELNYLREVSQHSVSQIVPDRNGL
jgi:hypothetical protein